LRGRRRPKKKSEAEVTGPAMLRRSWRWAVHTEGSTRAAALIRIGLVANLWARWGQELLLYKDLSATGIALSAGFFLTTTLMFMGLFTRVATVGAAVVAMTMYHVVGVELGREPWTHHHTYLLAFATFLCALTPCGRSFSIDRFLALRKARRVGIPAPPERGNLWGVRLMALQLSVIYLFTAYDKTSIGFLSGDRLEHIGMWMYSGSIWPRDPILHRFTTLVACMTVVLEYALAFMIFRPVRRLLLVPGLVMHGLFYVLLPVATYTATVWVLYLAYLDPDRVHALIDELMGHDRAPAP
jgi:hypothetical protein